VLESVKTSLRVHGNKKVEEHCIRRYDPALNVAFSKGPRAKLIAHPWLRKQRNDWRITALWRTLLSNGEVMTWELLMYCY